MGGIFPSGHGFVKSIYSLQCSKLRVHPVAGVHSLAHKLVPVPVSAPYFYTLYRPEHKDKLPGFLHAPS